jgi:hypothetical protein
MAPEHWESYVFNLIDLSPGAARKRFRQSIKDAWGCCAYCGRSHGDSGEALPLTLDHVRPRSYGGNTLRSNLIPACRCCNLSKGSERDWHGWYLKQDFYCQQRAQKIRDWLQPQTRENGAMSSPDCRDDHGDRGLDGRPIPGLGGLGGIGGFASHGGGLRGVAA